MIRLPITFKAPVENEAELSGMLSMEELLNQAAQSGRHVVLSITNETGTTTFYPKVHETGEVEQS